LYTGDWYASDAFYYESTESGGEAYKENAAVAHDALDKLSYIDPTPLCDSVNGTLHQLEGNEGDAKGCFVGAVLPGALDKIGKGAKAIKGCSAAATAAAGVAAKNADKLDEISDATKLAKGGESAATKRGREMHKEWDPGEGFTKEFTLPSGKRADAVNFETKQVKELKPNNTRGQKRGEKQLETYSEELESEFGGPWESILETYE
jgi:hypothetical protein